MEPDQPTEGEIRGRTEQNTVGVVTRLVTVEHTGDAGLLDRVWHEPNTDPALAFEGAGQRLWGAVRRD